MDLMPIRKHRRFMRHIRESIAAADKQWSPEEIEQARLALGYDKKPRKRAKAQRRYGHGT